LGKRAAAARKFGGKPQRAHAESHKGPPATQPLKSLVHFAAHFA